MKLTDTLTKKIAIGMFAVGTYFGSIHNTEGFWPFYTKITGKNYGINIAFCNEISSNAEFTGLQFGLVNTNEGITTGASLGIGNINCEGGVYDGFQIALGNGNAGVLNGTRLALMNLHPDNSIDDVVNGFDISLCNIGNKGNYVQVGVYNETPDKESLILNTYFDKVKQ